MLSGLILLTAATVAGMPSPPEPRPGQPGYSVAKAFVTIVRADAEVNMQDLSYAFGIPELSRGGFTWQGPFGTTQTPRFSAYYDPVKSQIGITKIAIFWDFSPLAKISGKSGPLISLTLHLRKEACPTIAEMTQLTGVPLQETNDMGPHGGPSYRRQGFSIPDGRGDYRLISYSSDPCLLTASYFLY